MGLKEIILGLILFLFLITIHEGGHFLGAKLSGIKVNEFSVGMGPGLLKRQKGETLYSFRLLPIGGYVMMEGEEGDSYDPRSYNNSAAWKRFLTIFAGPFANFLFAFLIFIIIANANGYSSTEVESVIDNSPAHIAGLRQDDNIKQVNGKNVYIFNQVSREISKSSGPVKLLIDRQGNDETFTIEPIEESGRKLIGVEARIKDDFLGSIRYGWHNTFFMTGLILEGLLGLLTGVFGLDQLSGPIGVISQVGASASHGLIPYLNFGAIISLNLGLFNILPIPALDGSKLVFILYEMITGRRANQKFEQGITILGFVFLMGLILVVTFKDISRLFGS